MKFFIDTAVVEEIKALLLTGLVDGVTTNPSLVAKTGRKFTKVIEEICQIVEGPVSAEVAATDYDGMLKEGLHLASIASNVTVKLPLTVDGLKVCKALANKEIKTNVTLCFSPAQALLAGKAGASFVSPFVGRLDDVGQDGLNLVSEILEIYSNYPRIDTEVLVASVRTPGHIIQAAKMGADVATLPPSLLWMLYKHPLTDKGLETFLKDWAATGQSIL